MEWRHTRSWKQQARSCTHAIECRNLKPLAKPICKVNRLLCVTAAAAGGQAFTWKNTQRCGCRRRPLRQYQINERLVWLVNVAQHIHGFSSFLFISKPADVCADKLGATMGRGRKTILSWDSTEMGARRSDPQWHHVWPHEEQRKEEPQRFHSQVQAEGQRPPLFVLLGFRLFRCTGLLLLRDWWKLGRAVLISFAFVELFGLLVELVQVEFPDYVFLVMLDRWWEHEQV